MNITLLTVFDVDKEMELDVTPLYGKNKLTIIATLHPNSAGENSFGHIFSTPEWNIFLGGGGQFPGTVWLERRYDLASGRYHTPFNVWKPGEPLKLAISIDLYSPESPKFYIDGEKVPTVRFTAPLGLPVSPKATSGIIGNKINGGRAFDGIIEELYFVEGVMEGEYIKDFFREEVVEEPEISLIRRIGRWLFRRSN